MHAEHHFEFGFLPKKSEKKESVGVSVCVCVCNFKRVRERGGEGKVKRRRVGSGGKNRRGFIVSERALFQHSHIGHQRREVFVVIIIISIN